MIDVGSATAETMVDRQSRRKTSTTSTARRAPMIMSCCTELMELRMNRALSETTSMRAPFGSSACSSGRSSLTRSATATVLAPDCFRTTSATACLPSRLATERASAGPSITLATSRTRMGFPIGAAITRSRSSSTEAASVSSFTTRSTAGSGVRPPGMAIDWTAMACETSVAAMPWARRRVGIDDDGDLALPAADDVDGADALEAAGAPASARPRRRGSAPRWGAARRWRAGRWAARRGRPSGPSGASASRGSFETVACTFSRTSLAATSSGTSRLNWRITTETLS